MKNKVHVYERMYVAKDYMLSQSLTEWEREGWEIFSVERTPDLEHPYEVLIRRQKQEQ